MIVNAGLVFAITPDDQDFGIKAEDIEWAHRIPADYGEINSRLVIRELSGKFDVPGVLAMHDKPVSFHPETRFISVTFACVPEDVDWPQYMGTTEVTAIIETGAPHTVAREVIDRQDRAAGMKMNKGLLP